MIITELTPNPDSLKFLSEKIISATGTVEFQKKDYNNIEGISIQYPLYYATSHPQNIYINPGDIPSFP